MSTFLLMLRNVAFIVIAFSGLYYYAMVQGNFMSWFLFYSFLPIFLYIVCFMVYPIKKWKVSRSFAKNIVQSGSKNEVTITIQRKLPFPIFYCICEEVLPDTLMKIDLRQTNYTNIKTSYRIRTNSMIKQIVYPSFKRKFHVTYELIGIPRGEHQLTTIKLQIGDLFGFIKKEFVYPLSNTFIAYPQIRPINMSEKMNSFEQGAISASTWQIKKTNVATGIRPYMPGDKFSWIHWKQSAKLNEMMTKEFEKEKTNDILLVLDACEYPASLPVLFDISIELCHSLLHSMLEKSYEIGLLSIGKEIIFFPAEQILKKERYQKYLTNVQQTGKNFSKQLQQEWGNFQRFYYTYIITSHMDDQMVESVEKIAVQSRIVHTIFIQLIENITDETYTLLQRLRRENVFVSVLTEKELEKSPIEVKVE